MDVVDAVADVDRVLLAAPVRERVDVRDGVDVCDGAVLGLVDGDRALGVDVGLGAFHVTTLDAASSVSGNVLRVMYARTSQAAKACVMTTHPEPDAHPAEEANVHDR